VKSSPFRIVRAICPGGTSRVMVTSRTPSASAGWKNELVVTRTSSPWNWLLASCRSVLARTYSGSPRASSYVQNTASSTIARFAFTS